MKYQNLETADARNTAIYRIARFSDVTGTAIDQVDSELIKTRKEEEKILMGCDQSSISFG